MDISGLVESAGKAIDLAGVAIILVGAVIATLVFLRAVPGAPAFEPVFRAYRQGLGRAILLGLELLVAADIVRTVAVSPTIESVVVLALIVLVRTFLSFTLEVELEGRWPWRRGTATTGWAGQASGTPTPPDTTPPPPSGTRG